MNINIQDNCSCVLLGDYLKSRLDRIDRKLDQIIKQEKIEMTNLTQLQDEVGKNTTVVGSVVTLVQNIKAQLDAAGTDPIALKALSDQLAANDTVLAKLVVDNTPVAPPAPVDNPNPTPGNPSPTV